MYDAGDLPAEQELIRACFQVDPDDRWRAVSGVINRVNWERFEVLIQRNGATPWAMHFLVNHFKDHLPDVLEYRWRQVFRSHAAYCMRLTGALEILAERFRSAHTPMATFKGPALGQIAYGDYALRTYQDLDIMIRSTDFRAAYEILVTKAGFKPMQAMNERELTAWARTGREFTFSSGGAMVDLHMRLTEGPARFSSGFVLPANLVALKLLSREVLVFTPEVHFVLLALHGTKHGWPEMRMVGDAAFLAHHAGLNMDEVGRLAGHYRCRRAVDLALWLAQDMCGLKVDRYLTDGKAPSHTVLRIGRHVAARLQSGNWIPEKAERLRMMLRLLDNLPARAGFVWHTITAPKLTDIREGHGLGSPMLGLMRPFRLIRRRISSWRAKSGRIRRS